MNVIIISTCRSISPELLSGLFPNYSSFDTGTHNIGIVIAIWTPVVMVSGYKEFFGFLFLCLW